MKWQLLHSDNERRKALLISGDPDLMKAFIERNKVRITKLISHSRFEVKSITKSADMYIKFLLHTEL